MPDPVALQQYYGLDGYWRGEVVDVSGHPPIDVRSRADFRDRIPVWYRALRRFQPRATSVLEIACSHGGFLAYCREHGIADVVGVEVSPDTCAFAKAKFGLPHVESGLFPDVTLPRKAFDAIVGFDVFEHFSDPVRAARAFHDLLEPGGLLLLQTPCYRGEDASWAQFRPSEHLFLFDAANVHRPLEAAGLSVTALTRAVFPDDMFVIVRRTEDATPALRKQDRWRAWWPLRKKATRLEKWAARRRT
jgi:SAM-dependent methyltransferase